jgi:hypothetical protein
MRKMRTKGMFIGLLIPALLMAAPLRRLSAETRADRVARSEPGTYCYDETDLLSETAPYVATSCPAPLDNVDAPRAEDTAETRGMKRMMAKDDADQEVQVGTSWQDPDADISPSASGQDVDDVVDEVAVSEASPPHSPDRSKPVVLIHGLDMRGPVFRDDCNKSWGKVIAFLRRRGWTNTIYPIHYYHQDIPCDDKPGLGPIANGYIAHHGSHAAHYSSGHRDGSHTAETSIRHLAYHFAWFLHDHFSSKNIRVEIVAHSMGGLISRYAINAVQRHFPGFPSKLLVEDIVTLGTPHSGSPIAALCGWLECEEMFDHSATSLLTYLKDYAQNPQGAGGTQWSVIGSTRDLEVPSGSATAMNVPNKAKYQSSAGIGHSEYMQEDRVTYDAEVDWWDQLSGTWRHSTSAPWPVPHIDLSLFSSGW